MMKKMKLSSDKRARVEEVKRQKRMSVVGRVEEPSRIGVFRAEFLAKGFDLVDVTQLCEFRLGNSGWCSDFNEPSENCYHIQAWYRGVQVAVFDGSGAHAVDGSHEVYADGEDFIIFRKVKV
jgi:hypothetical protein